MQKNNGRVHETGGKGKNNDTRTFSIIYESWNYLACSYRRGNEDLDDLEKPINRRAGCIGGREVGRKVGLDLVGCERRRIGRGERLRTAAYARARKRRGAVPCIRTIRKTPQTPRKTELNGAIPRTARCSSIGHHSPGFYRTEERKDTIPVDLLQVHVDRKDSPATWRLLFATLGPSKIDRITG